ncbi:MAG: M67 family metallopeptidase [Anaerolineales bacterium]|nr:M67 family metallopeptidase [Chloroflexota bacterium]MBL7161959.1 M67 family metallopeptidase [Anaerolineales bacterium]
MQLKISKTLLEKIHTHGEESYPEEGAGFLLGRADATSRLVTEILTLTNTREDTARHNRYLLTPQDMLRAERKAERLGLDVIGVFHSHPDHPNQPSEFDREWAMPWFSYIITSVHSEKAIESRSWRLTDDRARFVEEIIQVNSKQ